MKAHAVGLLVGAAVLLPVPALAESPGPGQESEPSRPPGWVLPEEDGYRFSPEPGVGPDGPRPPGFVSPAPTAPTEPTATPSGSPSADPGSPSPSASEPSPPAPAEEPVADRSPVPRTVSRAPAHPWVPLPERPAETFGTYDLYADYAEEAESADGAAAVRQAAAPPVGGPVLPVLSLGAGMASVGLGLAFLGLRLRRR
ncbi:hypothetical protein IF129_22070 [Streptomyces chumphonensis]|uniref:Uncharacterized protein n=1 Tax=Streptomyces chumphonensis TaxID=1214925 RepID=A0A927F4J8_9ACTN|nr:hypothetical protein [Streptomyces chumphonensis]MBD3934237.1 hypothetical protein [Streptomyces chumphonensis]